MKKNVAEFWPYFVNIISNILFVIWQDFVIVWQNTPCTVRHPAVACLTHWCYWTVLPDGIILQVFLQRWCNFTCWCAWASEGFIQGRTSGFFWKFLQGWLKVVKFVFYHI